MIHEYRSGAEWPDEEFDGNGPAPVPIGVLISKWVDETVAGCTNLELISARRQLAGCDGELLWAVEAEMRRRSSAAQSTGIAA